MYLLVCQMREINSTSRGGCLGPIQAQLITMHSYDSQTKVGQSKGWLSAMWYGYDLWSIGWVFSLFGAWSGPLLWSGYLSSTATPHKFLQIHITHISYFNSRPNYIITILFLYLIFAKYVHLHLSTFNRINFRSLSSH